MGFMLGREAREVVQRAAQQRSQERARLLELAAKWASEADALGARIGHDNARVIDGHQHARELREALGCGA